MQKANVPALAALTLAAAAVVVAAAAFSAPSAPASHVGSSNAPDTASPVVITRLPMAAKWQDVPGEDKRFQDADGTRYRGMTKWFFHCRPRLQCQLLAARQTPRETQITLTVRRVSMELSLDVDSACGKRKHTQEHEQGHVEICRRIYDQRAESAARKACQAVIGKQFRGRGASSQAAFNAAKKQAAQQICRQYRAATADVAEAVSRAYDEVTKHAHNQVSAADGIKEAFRRAGR